MELFSNEGLYFVMHREDVMRCLATVPPFYLYLHRWWLHAKVHLSVPEKAWKEKTGNEFKWMYAIQYFKGVV